MNKNIKKQETFTLQQWPRGGAGSARFLVLSLISYYSISLGRKVPELLLGL